jgi:hypothetical protein
VNRAAGGTPLQEDPDERQPAPDATQRDKFIGSGLTIVGDAAAIPKPRPLPDDDAEGGNL